jgi:amino acid transporter
MQRTAFWIGTIFCVIGLALVLASIVMNYFGLEASYNFGDPAKYQFFLVPFWQIGLAITAIGCVFLLSSRALRTLG